MSLASYNDVMLECDLCGKHTNNLNECGECGAARINSIDSSIHYGPIFDEDRSSCNSSGSSVSSSSGSGKYYTPENSLTKNRTNKDDVNDMLKRKGDKHERFIINTNRDMFNDNMSMSNYIPITQSLSRTPTPSRNRPPTPSMRIPKKGENIVDYWTYNTSRNTPPYHFRPIRDQTMSHPLIINKNNRDNSSKCCNRIPCCTINGGRKNKSKRIRKRKSRRKRKHRRKHKRKHKRKSRRKSKYKLNNKKTRKK